MTATTDTHDMTRTAIIGSGPMGLRAAVELLDNGVEVDILERDDRIGGMSAHFDFDGLDIERYYHFVCKTDQPLFDLLARYGLSERLKWTDTKMGYYYRGTLYRWGSPTALLSFPHLSLVQKVRYARHVMHTKGIDDWTALDKREAGEWIRDWIGDAAYEVMWKDSFRLKFFEYADNLSASWIGTRIKRIGLSRRNLFHESLGYLEGGSDLVLDALAADVQARGGRILLGSRVDEVVSEGGRVVGIRCNGSVTPYDRVLSTAPIQYVPKMVPGLPDAVRAQVDALENIPVACVILKLSQPVSDNFWMNISDPRIAIPGVIEYSNLNPLDRRTHILYAPFYMPKTHPKWSSTNEALIEEVLGYLPLINPAFRREWVLASACHRYEHAQAICPPGFQAMLPPMRSALPGFFMADTAYYYPEDRSISESLEVGRRLAAEALASNDG